MYNGELVLLLPFKKDVENEQSIRKKLCVSAALCVKNKKSCLY